jgi:twinkle protein
MTASVRGPYLYGDKLADLYHKGLPPGDKTGWPAIDGHYTVCPGQLTLLTGWPGSGKSEWLDALMVNLTHQGWNFAVFSPENRPTEIHIAKLMEKFTGMPFGAGPTKRMSLRDMQDMLEELKSKFGFIDSENGDALSVEAIITAATPWFEKRKEAKWGLVIDPWNELEHWRPRQFSETEYISQQLSYVRNWARASSVHVWIVAHPQKVAREGGKLPVPRPDMISGSQHWWNKADCAITVWRDMENPGGQDVDVHIQKIRFKHIGRPGVVTLKYDRVTGRYHEPVAIAQVRY